MTSTRTYGELRGSARPAWTISVGSDGFLQSSPNHCLSASVLNTEHPAADTETDPMWSSFLKKKLQFGYAGNTKRDVELGGAVVEKRNHLQTGSVGDEVDAREGEHDAFTVPQLFCS